MTEPEARSDLLRGLLQSCYVIEHAREGLQRRWGGDFERDAGTTAQRAERLGRLLDEHGFRRTDEVISPHTDWFESLCGSEPTEVPLGAAVLHNFGKWSDVFCEPYLDDIKEFIELASEHTRVDVELRTMTEEEAFLPTADLPEGRLFVILTDVHVGSRTGERLTRRAIAEINEIGPEFVVMPGDFTEDGEPEQFRLAREIFEGLTCPYYAVLGNHDAVQRSTREPFGEKLYAETFGIESQDFVLECGDLQIALVNSTDPTASPFPDWDVSRGSVGGIAAGVDSGALRPGQAEELAQRLDPQRQTLLIQHHELHPFPGFPPVKFALREEDAAAELEALRDHDLIGLIAGHTHRSAVLKVGDGSLTQLEIPSLKDWPFAYSVAGVSEAGVQVVVRQVSDRDLVWRFSHQMPPLMRRFAVGGPWANLSYTFSR
ncbi:MAG: metallophosphoesterase family protein [Actinomycetota bacterium]